MNSLTSFTNNATNTLKSDVAIGTNSIISYTNQGTDTIKSYTSQGIGQIENAYATSVTDFNTLSNQINATLQSLAFKPQKQNQPQSPPPNYVFYFIGGLLILYIL